VDFKPKLAKSKKLIADSAVSRSLPIYIFGFALPRVDFRDIYSNVFGISKRVLRSPPKGNRQVKREFRKFVHYWIKDHLKPLRDADYDFEFWLAQTNYTNSRKDELRHVRDEYFKTDVRLDPYIRRVKSFIKDESYVEYKMPRFINSRSDLFKCLTGPYFKAIEQVLFKRPEFIKYVPVMERPKYLMDNIYKAGHQYYSTDFSSFESHFTTEMQQACEMQLYKYMLSGTTEGRRAYELIRYALSDEPFVLKGGGVTVELSGKRMSGEMCTSLGNGFSNLMLILFAAKYADTHIHGVVVEGDDGLFSVPFNSGITTQTFVDLGFRCKIDLCSDIQTASFCGNVFDEYDLVNVTDPREVLVDFGWTKRTDVKASSIRLEMLSRAKAYSMAHQYRGCPVIGSFACYVLRATRRAHTKLLKVIGNVNDKSFTLYERDQLVEAIKANVSYQEPGYATRKLVSRLYNLAIDEQLELERFFNQMNKPMVLDHPLIRCWDMAYPVWREYFETYGQVSTQEDIMCRQRRDPKLALTFIDECVEL